MAQIIVTQKVAVNLNRYLLEKIIRILREKDKNTDYLQVFEIKENQLINSQEVPPQINTYNLMCKFKENIKIWAIENYDKEIGRCWTILFPEEY